MCCFKSCCCLLLAGLTFAPTARAALLTNGGFESGLAGWRSLWTREANAGSLRLDHSAAHSGSNAARIEHHGAQDWSLEPALRLPVQAGDIFEWEAWVRLAEAQGGATLCVALYDATGQAREWSFAARKTTDTADWQRLHTRFLVPPGITQLQPRLIGRGPVVAWLDDFQGERTGQVDPRQMAKLASSLTLTNQSLVVSFQPTNAALTVLDRRTGKRLEPVPVPSEVWLTGAAVEGGVLRLEFLHAASGLAVTGTVRLERDLPEFTFELAAQGALPGTLKYPLPFASEAGEFLVVPMNEGISYPVTDPSIEPMTLIAYGGHGICMAFWGVTDGTRGHMAIIETPDDAAIRIGRHAGRLDIAPQWEAQRGEFGYARRLRYVFFDQGGHVAMAKRYRAYAQQIGRFKTLAEKRRENPNVDLLVGAVNVWSWDRDAVPLVKEMQAAGIERILWSNRQSPENLAALNDLGVLTSRYDIYQDVMAPSNFPHLGNPHADWVTEAWPDDIVRTASGDWLRGWAVKGKTGAMYSCGVLCDRRAPAYAARRIPAELATHPYRSRFIDTTTAAPWHECYHPAHPMTRTDSREWKMKLLNYISRDSRLVAGCETGHDAAVPFLHYFEGMMSLGPYRVPDAGRDMARIWTNAPADVVKFQLGHAYRLPLWELVYHDCVVAQWYWGDYNNKLPAFWDQRDLFNLLYATPPMFMFHRALWAAEKARFVRSYQQTCPTIRRVGYSEMTDHRFLTPDRSVQQTTFANGVKVTVNFGPSDFRQADGVPLGPLGYRVE